MFRVLPALLIGVTIAVPIHTASAREQNEVAGRSETLGLDVSGRISLARRLGTSQGAAFPDARDSLLTMVFRDEAEAVRYEAAVALRNVLAHRASEAGRTVDGRCSQPCGMRTGCSPRPRGLIRRFLARVFGGHRERPAEALMSTEPVAFNSASPDTRPPCDHAMRDALLEIVNGRDEQGRFQEPSSRVRAAVTVALSFCRSGPSVAPDAENIPPLPGKDKSEGAEEPEIEEPPADAFDFDPLAAIPNARSFSR
jgi:hypothetical protein